MRSNRLQALACALCLVPTLSLADPVREWRQAHEPAILAEFQSLLAIPNVVGEGDGIARNAAFLLDRMRERGLKPQALTGENAQAPPLLYGEWLVPGVKRTLVLYAHYDGQPVTPEDWASDPFTPTWRDGRHDQGGTVQQPAPGDRIDPDWRLYARGASDDKAGVIAILNAVSALRARGLKPTWNLKFVFDGEEEAGSPHLASTITRHKALLKSDGWLICDGPVHATGRKQIVYGVRGDTNVELTVYGPKRPLHSGHYGNWAQNPAHMLATVLASMKDASGRVAIAGWYDDVVPLGEAERKALAAAPNMDAAISRDLGLAAPEMAGVSLVEAINLPSLNINGMRAADVGAKARNVIPTEAHATLDLRLVKGNDPSRQVERVRAHLRTLGYLVLDRAPTDEERLANPKIVRVGHEGGGYAASRTAMDHPFARPIASALERWSPEPIVHMPTLGGSLPLIILNEILGVPTVGMPIANPDNNQHAENENIRLGHFWDGIEMMAAVMRAK